MFMYFNVSILLKVAYSNITNQSSRLFNKDKVSAFVSPPVPPFFCLFLAAGFDFLILCLGLQREEQNIRDPYMYVEYPKINKTKNTVICVS